MNDQVNSDPLYRDPRLADFYDLDNGWGDDTRYCEKLARDADSRARSRLWYRPADGRL